MIVGWDGIFFKITWRRRKLHHKNAKKQYSAIDRRYDSEACFKLFNTPKIVVFVSRFKKYPLP